MSCCWKCGRELLIGQVECDPACDGPVEGEHPVEQFKRGRPMTLQMTFRPIVEKISAPQDHNGFTCALEQFLRGVIKSFQDSGLNSFCHIIENPEDEA